MLARQRAGGSRMGQIISQTPLGGPVRYEVLSSWLRVSLALVFGLSRNLDSPQLREVVPFYPFPGNFTELSAKTFPKSGRACPSITVSRIDNCGAGLSVTRFFQMF